ncbi:hypothetical protein SMACR_02998 [Sordaria macrospora]|uniref:WGS project CABT00000000 data, contig 2.12 n=2 Tax=Sordaria macrospora TaxID=5147 RepID=F7VY33_SORMK|nr:uncharacterized protein SMAC_02998 [Sordaria macrospora k-hell]KAA8634585.1 hypothetical protein SMACR_02998 [Sordaria macrospora]KAH7634871.1 hypothetical protein B0T09DRAFT_13525 [Sordaria sp. MPI-SDFR-AT-0083]WPJ58357.1 hypothetical protein SMAC4_02998 [Sordaria macrospora]CCC10427.1 unnamed protein product [Sordaria macrospora k-hell]
MESIQLAQMLADLSDLNAAQESQAAIAVVNANKSAGQPAAESSHQSLKPSTDQPPIRPNQLQHQRVASTTSLLSRTASSARYDKYGRPLATPPMTRTNSNHGSIPGTPRRESEPEDDIDRAHSLMALYEIRTKLKQQDTTSIDKLRDKIAALQSRYQTDKKDGSDAKISRFIYPKTQSPPSS